MMIKMKILLVALLLCFSTVSADTLRASVPEEEDVVARPNQRRELFDIFQVLFMGGCPPGPLGHHCRHPPYHNGSSSGGSSGSSSGSSSGGSSSSNGYNTYGGQDASGSSSSSRDVNGVFNAGQANAAIWMLLVAVAAAAVAAMAIVFGQRKALPETHPLTGSVARRAALFGAFADSALCAEGPQTAVEMTAPYESHSAVV